MYKWECYACGSFNVEEIINSYGGSRYYCNDCGSRTSGFIRCIYSSGKEINIPLYKEKTYIEDYNQLELNFKEIKHV